jgi:hypothetical protein
VIYVLKIVPLDNGDVLWPWMPSRDHHDSRIDLEIQAECEMIQGVQHSLCFRGVFKRMTTGLGETHSRRWTAVNDDDVDGYLWMRQLVVLITALLGVALY